MAGPLTPCGPRSVAAYGPPEIIEVDDIPAPPVGLGQVRVRVDAAAVNFPDVLLMANDYQVKVPTPFVPGSEFAGVVTEMSADVAGFASGDRVFGSTLFGAFAEEVVVGAHAITHVPAESTSDPLPPSE